MYNYGMLLWDNLQQSHKISFVLFKITMSAWKPQVLYQLFPRFENFILCPHNKQIYHIVLLTSDDINDET